MPFHPPITDEAALVVGDNPSPYGFLNRPPNNVWGDIQSDEQILAGMDAANPWTINDALNEYFGTSVNPHMPPAQGFQGLEGDRRYVEGMGFPAVEGHALVNVGDYNLDWDRYEDVASAQYLAGGPWEPMVEEYSPSYGDDALVNVDVAESVREIMSAFENDTGETFKLESAFRTPFHNFAVGGEPRTEFSEGSKHMQGISLDVTDEKSLAWLKKNGEKYGWVLADYTKKDGTKNKNHFNYDSSAIYKYNLESVSPHHNMWSPTIPPPTSGYQQLDKNPMDDPGRLMATQEGLAQIERLATIDPKSTRNSRMFAAPGNEGYLYYPRNATDKQKAAFDHMMERYEGDAASPRNPWFASAGGGYWDAGEIYREEGALPMARDSREWSDYAARIYQGKMGIPVKRDARGQVSHKDRRYDPAAEQDAAIQFEDPTGMADPHGIYHHATEAMKTIPFQRGVPYIYPKGMKNYNKVYQHEAVHSIIDDYRNASAFGHYKGTKGSMYENSPLAKIHQVVVDLDLGRESVNELMTRLVDLEELGDGSQDGLFRIQNMNIHIQSSYEKWKAGDLSDYQMKLELVKFISVFDIKDIIQETSGMEHMSAEHTARIKELSYNKLKEAIGADPDTQWGLQDVSVSRLMESAEKKVKDFNMAEKINAISDKDFKRADVGGRWVEDRSWGVGRDLHGKAYNDIKKGKEYYINSFNESLREAYGPSPPPMGNASVIGKGTYMHGSGEIIGAINRRSQLRGI